MQRHHLRPSAWPLPRRRRLPRLSRVLVRSGSPRPRPQQAIPPGEVLQGDFHRGCPVFSSAVTAPASPSTRHGRGRSDIPLRRHDCGRPVAASTAVAFRFPPPCPTQPHRQRRQPSQPSHGLVCGGGPHSLSLPLGLVHSDPPLPPRALSVRLRPSVASTEATSSTAIRALVRIDGSRSSSPPWGLSAATSPTAARAATSTKATSSATVPWPVRSRSRSLRGRRGDVLRGRCMASSAATDPATLSSRPGGLVRSDPLHGRSAALTGVLRGRVYGGGDDRRGSRVGSPPRRRGLVRNCPQLNSPRQSARARPHRRRPSRPSLGLVRGDGPRSRSPPGGLVRDDMPAVVQLMRQAPPSPL